MRLKTACCVRNQSACSSDSRMRAARPGSQQWPARPPSARPRKGWGAKARGAPTRVVGIARESLTPRGGYNARWCEQHASAQLPPSAPAGLGTWPVTARPSRCRTQGPELGNTASHTRAESSPCVRWVFRKSGSLCAQPGDWGRNPGTGDATGGERSAQPGEGRAAWGEPVRGPALAGARHPSGRQLRSPRSRRTRHPAPSHGVGVTRCASTRRPPHRRGPPRPRKPGRRRGRRSPPSPPTRP